MNRGDHTTGPRPYRGFSDDSQVGNVVWWIFWFFLVGLIARSLLS